jgi:hypothetical protein
VLAPDEAVPVVIRHEVAGDAIDRKELSRELAGASWRRLLRRVGEFAEAINADGRDGFRRHLLDRLFDALGYSSNRTPMRMLAADLWEQREEVRTLREILQHIADRSGLRPECRAEIERVVGDVSRTHDVVPIEGIEWDYAVRPGSAPEIRLVAGGVLFLEIVSGRLIREARERIVREDAVGALRRLLVERIGDGKLLGIGRRDELIVNVIIPAVIASAIRLADVMLIERGCALYRRYPSLTSNRVVRSIERRWNGGRGIAGAFFQQGAIELHQTYFREGRSR